MSEAIFSAAVRVESTEADGCIIIWSEEAEARKAECLHLTLAAGLIDNTTSSHTKLALW